MDEPQQLIEGLEFRRFILIGFINTAIFYGLYEGWYFLFEGLPHRAVMGWVFAYALSSLIAHTTHRIITFRSNVPLDHTLPVAVMVYTTTMILSTISEIILIEVLDWNHRLAWVVNASVFGLIIYIALRHLAFPTRLSENE